MGEQLKSLLVKIPADTHKKFKLISVQLEKGMKDIAAELISEYVKEKELKINENTSVK